MNSSLPSARSSAFAPPRPRWLNSFAPSRVTARHSFSLMRYTPTYSSSVVAGSATPSGMAETPSTRSAARTERVAGLAKFRETLLSTYTCHRARGEPQPVAAEAVDVAPVRHHGPPPATPTNQP